MSQCESHHVPEYFISVILLNKKKITLENKEAPLHGALALVGVYFFEEELNLRVENLSFGRRALMLALSCGYD